MSTTIPDAADLGRTNGPPAPERGRIGAAHWKQVIHARIALARDELAALRAQQEGDDSRLNRVAELLNLAEDATRPRGVRHHRVLWGSAIDRAFTSLHAALVVIAKCAPEEELDGRLRSAMARLRATMPSTEERRSVLEKHCTALANGSARRRGGEGTSTKRWVVVKALEWSYGASDAQYARLRSFRNIVFVMSLVVTLVVVGLTVIGALWPESLSLCFKPDPPNQVCPTGVMPNPRDALMVTALGATGGATAAVLTVRNMKGTSTPYGVPLALALLKLPFGALSALLGLLLIHGRFIPGLTDLDTSGQILAYAVFLGVAQHVVTALVDRRGQELMEHIPAKRCHGEEPSDTPPLGSNAPRTATTTQTLNSNGLSPK